MKTELLLLCFANAVIVALCSYKDEAIVKWPFCEFKEAAFEKLYYHLDLHHKPKFPLYCHLPYYEWHTDSSPDFEKVSAEIAYLMDVDESYVDVIATFWSTGRIATHGGGFGVLEHAAEGVDISKYYVTSFTNNHAGIAGLFLKAKDEKDENLIYVEICEYSNKFPKHALISEKDFLLIWNEHIKGQVLEGKCHEHNDL